MRKNYISRSLWHNSFILEQCKRYGQKYFIVDDSTDIEFLSKVLLNLYNKVGDNMQDIKDYNTFTKIKPVNKGWSGDKKYYIETADGEKLLLRVADISEYDRKKAEFEMMKQIAALEVPMSQPVDFGTCNNGKSVYSLITWCDGEDAEAVLPYLTETEQYVLGIKSGEILKKIHSIPAPKEQEEWDSRFNHKTNMKIENTKPAGFGLTATIRSSAILKKTTASLTAISAANRPLNFLSCWPFTLRAIRSPRFIGRFRSGKAKLTR